ncbi:MAG TPA: sensor histidine kinase [Pseudacidobacterium sp.]|jgi:two-component system sensor histidine kinase DesK|nr:sensor histidine kinase [Pseudacidobacterium sp.]
MAEYTHNSEIGCAVEARKAAHQEVARRWMAGKANKRYFDFVWILYSLFFFIEPLERNNRHFWIRFLVFYAIFVVLYSGLLLARTKRQAYLFLTALGISGIAWMPFVNSGISSLIYVVAFAPFIVESIYVVFAVLGGICITAVLSGILLHLSPWTWGTTVGVSIIVGITNLFTAQKIRATRKLDSAYEEIEHLAKIAERERIARDLHDVLGHTLSVVVLKSELAGRLMDRDPEHARAEIRDVEQIARKALAEVREAIGGYRSEGLPAEIDRARRTLDAAGVTLMCDSKPPLLTTAEESVLSLAVREAVTNIVRHAQASQCRMRFVAENGHTSFTVEDDGRGNIRQEGNGLRGMRERIEALGGRFSIDCKEGTRLNIEIPIRTA